jgi:hypothetical protein
MIRVGQRAFVIPLWLWAAVPLAFVAYACLDLGLATGGQSSASRPDHRFLTMMTQLATASLAGFVLIDLIRRAQTPWWGVPLVCAASAATAMLVSSAWLGQAFHAAFQAIAGAALALAGWTRGGADVLALYLAMLAVLLLVAIGVALAVTLAMRLLAGLPLLGRDTRRELVANLAGAGIWLLAALGGTMVIRGAYDLTQATPMAGSGWLLLALATCLALGATMLHLTLMQRSRRRATAEGGLRVWLLAALCVLALLARPELLGETGVRAYHDYVRPLLRAVRVLPPAVHQPGLARDGLSGRRLPAIAAQQRPA